MAMTGAAKAHHQRGQEYSKLTSQKTSTRLRRRPLPRNKPANRPHFQKISQKNGKRKCYPPIPQYNHVLMSEKKIYTDAEDITHWAMREERHPRPSLGAHKRGIQVGQRRAKASCDAYCGDPPSKNFCMNVLWGRSLLLNKGPSTWGSCFQKFTASW